MKGSIGTATYLSYTRPYWGKVISRLNYIEKLSPNEKSIKGRHTRNILKIDKALRI